MSASLHALLAGAVDYAGLFPPAGLPLEQAARDYARYREEPEAWMLGRFVCLAARLNDLGRFPQLFQGGTPLALAVLGRGGATLHDFQSNLKVDLDDLAAFCRGQGPAVNAEALEVRLP